MDRRFWSLSSEYLAHMRGNDQPPHSPAPIRVLAIHDAAAAKAISWQTNLNGLPEDESRL